MFESKFMGREPFKRPACPFCGMPIERPKELNTRMPGEMPVGSCTCGAVYACDETGHNIGSAMVEALVFGCNMDWDLAWGLTPGEDYLEEIVEHYDLPNHLIVTGRVFRGRRVSGVLYFVRVQQDVQEVTAEGVRKRIAKATPPHHAPHTKHGEKKALSKREVEGLVKAFKIEPIIERAGQDRKLIRNLQRLLYSGDDLFRMRAAEILGRVSAIIAETDPGTVSKLLQRLFTALMDTAAFTWGAFDAIGEIISHKPDLFAGYAPQLYQFIIDETRRAQVLRTLGKVAKASPDILRKHTLHFISYLNDPDPSVRGYAAWLMGNLGASETKEDVSKLLHDDYELPMYENGILERKTVGRIAAEALEKF